MSNLNEKFLIIPEQLEMLNMKMAEKTDRLNQSVNYLRSNNGEVVSSCGDSSYVMPAGDDISKSEQRRTIDGLRKYAEVLENCEIITTYNSSFIDIGTHFQILISAASEKSIETLTLLHKRIADEDYERYISCDTLLGISLKGKKVNDTFKVGDAEVTVLKIYSNNLGEETLTETKTR